MQSRRSKGSLLQGACGAGDACDRWWTHGRQISQEWTGDSGVRRCDLTQHSYSQPQLTLC